MLSSEDRLYLLLRRIFFWIFFFLFIILAPTILFYSFGYKFDINKKKFLRTGAIAIRTIPRGAKVYLNGKDLDLETPCTLREIFPGKYEILLEKEGFYPYKVTNHIMSRLVWELEALLVPEIKDVEKIDRDFDVYNMFFYRYILGVKNIVFTDKGIYIVSEDFSTVKELSTLILDKDIAKTIKGVKEIADKFIFWNENNIWLIESLTSKNGSHSKTSVIYKAQEGIVDLFSGLRGRYLIIQDGLKVIALDIKRDKMIFPVYMLNSINSKIFYDFKAEVLFIKDRVLPTNSFSLFKIKLLESPHEKKTN